MSDSTINAPDDFVFHLYLTSELDLDRENVLDLIRRLAGGNRGVGFTIHNRLGDLTVFLNDRALEGDDTDDFVNWPYYVEILPLRGSGIAEYLVFLNGLIARLRQLGYRCVAAGDFEDRLNP